MEVLEVSNLEKSYDGRKVLNNISFSVNENQILGIIGQNGAGKTTLIECILGLRQQDEGSVYIYGKNVKDNLKEIKREIGAQLQDCIVSAAMKVHECIRFQAAAFGIKVNIDEQLRIFDLEEQKNKFFSNLSSGQQQRLLILLSNIHNPKILFFDELTTGLDPSARKKMHRYLLSLKEAGKTVIMSTHLMEEIELLCDKVIFIKEGEVLKNDTPVNLLKELPYKYIATVNSSENLLTIKSKFKDCEGIIDINQDLVKESIFIIKVKDLETCKTIEENINSNNDMFSDYKFNEVSMDDVYNEFNIVNIGM